MVIGPGVFEPMREQFDGLGAPGIQNQKASRRGTNSTDQAKKIFHCVPSRFFTPAPDSPASAGVVGGWMQRVAAAAPIEGGNL